MSNEELANAIRAGRIELLPVLWGQVQRFLYLKAKDWYNYMPELCRRSGVEQEDLEQEAYFAFLDALNHWDSEAGYKFLTFTAYPLRNRFNALCGRRTEAQKKQLLNNCKSLYSPVAGEEDLYLLDLIHDAAAEEDFLDAEAAIYNKQLHDDLEQCLATLPDLTQKVIRKKYYECLTYREIAKELGMEEGQALSKEGAGLRELRRGKNRLRLMPYVVRRSFLDCIPCLEADIQSDAYRSGISGWRNTGTSSTERAVLRREKLKR